jgi:hypothetical protein
MKEESLATEFRTKGAALARAKTEGFAGVFFGLSTTLATRIRSEVLAKEHYFREAKFIEQLFNYLNRS